MERAEIRNDVLRFLSTLEEVLEPWQDWLTLVHGLYLQGKFRELEIERDHGQAILDRLQGFLQERSRYLSRLREQGIVVGGLKDALIYGGGTNEEVKQLERYSLRMQTLRQQSLACGFLHFNAWNIHRKCCRSCRLEKRKSPPMETTIPSRLVADDWSIKQPKGRAIGR